MEHYDKSHDDRHKGILFAHFPRKSPLSNHRTTKDTQLCLICKTAVKHDYNSHYDNRHTVRSLISKTAMEHYDKSHDDRHKGILFAHFPRKSPLSNHRTTKDTQLCLICKTAVKHDYNSHYDNRHTVRSLISKTATEHYDKSHDDRHKGILFAHFPRKSPLSNHRTTKRHLNG